MNFFENLNTEGIPVDVNIDIPDKTLALLGLAIFVSILLALILSGIITHAITKRMA